MGFIKGGIEFFILDSNLLVFGEVFAKRKEGDKFSPFRILYQL